MGNKKVRVFAVGAFVFAKVKGYPAWPAKITGVIGKRYGIYFYGTGESATLPPNEIFDYFDSKQQFAAKSIKRKFYQEGILELETELQMLNVTSNENLPDETLNESQIENPVADQSSASVEDAAEPEPVKTDESPAPVEEPASAVVPIPEEKVDKPVAKKRGRKSSSTVVKEQAAAPSPVIAPAAVEEPEPQVESAAPEELSAPNEPEAASEPAPVVEEPVTTPVEPKTNDEEIVEDATVEEPMEEAPVVKGRGKRGAPKTPASAPPSKAPRRSNKVATETPTQEVPKTPTVVPPTPEGTSRSGRKIKPKKYTDMEIDDVEGEEEPPLKKRKSVEEPEQSQQPEAVTEAEPETPTPTRKSVPKTNVSARKNNTRSQNGISKRNYKIVRPHEIQDIQEPITKVSGDELTESNILKHTLLSMLPDDRIVGIKLFTNPPASFGTPEDRLRWENTSAKSALKLKEQLESGEIDMTSVLPQLDLNVPLLEDEIKALMKQRGTEAEKARLNLLRTECKLLDLVDKVTGTLCFDSADCDKCVEILEQMGELEVDPIMLIKHPNVMETIKRCRRYVGNLEHWKMNSEQKTEFTKKAHLIRLKAEHCYNLYKKPFGIEENKRFWEFFMLKVQRFKEITEKMNEVDILKIYTEPKELADLRPDDMEVVEVSVSKAKISTKQASSKSIKS